MNDGRVLGNDEYEYGNKRINERGEKVQNRAGSRGTKQGWGLTWSLRWPDLVSWG